MKLVEVEWIDSSGSAGDTWQDKDVVIAEASKPDSMACWACGYLVCEDDRQVTLALGHNGEQGMVLTPTAIPRCAIVSIRDLVPASELRVA